MSSADTGTTAARFRFVVDPWDPSYGASVDEALEPSTAQVAADVEVPSDRWAPIRPSVDPAPRVLFVDGVRRIDARVWIDGTDGDQEPGICASWAAGAVRCDGTAEIVTALVERGLFSASPNAADVATRAGVFSARLASAPTMEALSLALQRRMAAAEADATEAAVADEPADLVVLDGPLRGRGHVPGAVGMVKTHQSAYLPRELHGVVGRLAAGERTPVFGLGTTWDRYSWYVRLPGPEGAAWAGVVRCECSADLAPAAAKALADRTTATLPRFASEPHKDGRAPQNLYPIAALERDLRHRLGDPGIVYRALRVAAAMRR